MCLYHTVGAGVVVPTQNFHSLVLPSDVSCFVVLEIHWLFSWFKLTSSTSALYTPFTCQICILVKISCLSRQEDCMIGSQRPLVSSRDHRVPEFSGRTYTTNIIGHIFQIGMVGNWKCPWKHRVYQCGVQAEEDGEDTKFKKYKTVMLKTVFLTTQIWCDNERYRCINAGQLAGQETNRTETCAKMARICHLTICSCLSNQSF